MARARFVQFYITDRRGQVERLGSDGVEHLDGRWSLTTMHHYAWDWAIQRGATGYQLRSGTFSNYEPFSPVIQLDYSDERNT